MGEYGIIDPGRFVIYCIFLLMVLGYILAKFTKK